MGAPLYCEVGEEGRRWRDWEEIVGGRHELGTWEVGEEGEESAMRTFPKTLGYRHRFTGRGKLRGAK